MGKHVTVREATRDKKQLDFGFLLNRLDPPPVSLDIFEELFFPASYQAGKSSSKSLDNVKTLAEKVPHKVWIWLPPPLFLKNVQTQAEKRFFEKFLESFGFGLDPPPPPSAKIQSRAAFFPLWLPLGTALPGWEIPSLVYWIDALARVFNTVLGLKLHFKHFITSLATATFIYRRFEIAIVQKL